MFNNQRRQTTQVGRFERLPNLNDIAFLQDQSRGKVGRACELAWQSPKSPLVYRLLCTCRQNSFEPSWELLTGEGRNEVEVWTYQTTDVALILNLVLSESTDSISDAIDHAALLGESADRNTGMSSSYSTSLLGLQSVHSTGHKLPSFQTLAGKKAPTMEGKLEDMPIPTLLQSMNMGGMTGKVVITDEMNQSELFFDGGDLVHATCLNFKGDLAITELVTWETGKFFFFKDEKSDQRTVKKRLDGILMEAVTLLDQSRYLFNTGLKMDLYIAKKYPNLSEAEFEAKIREAAPHDLAPQKEFYVKLDGNQTLFDILREKPMPKRDWVPVMFNLMQCDLIELRETPLRPDKTKLLQATVLDRVAIDNIFRSLKRSDTNVISYPAFQFFLEMEYNRYQLFGTPFCVVIFDMWMVGVGKQEPLPVQALAEASKRINNLKRSIDIMAHFETFNYGLLLPNTETASAAILCHRILEVLNGSPLMMGMDQRKAALSFGIAGVPEDCRDISLLLSAAKVAKNVAQQSEFPIVMFKDLQAPT